MLKTKAYSEKTAAKKNLLKIIKLKQKLYNSHFLNGCESDKLYFKQFANKLTCVKTQSKKAFYHSAISKRKKEKTILSNYGIL